MKTCSTCNLEKDLSEFHKNKKRADGLRHECKSCVKEYWIELKARPTIRFVSKVCLACGVEKGVDEFDKDVYRKDGLTKRCNKCNKESALKFQRENPKKTLLSGCKARAKKKGLPFDLDLEDIIIPEKCPMLGIKLMRNLGQRGPSSSSPSLDRIIPEKGYTKGNVQVISTKANMIKSNATADELMAVAKYCKEQETEE